MILVPEDQDYLADLLINGFLLNSELQTYITSKKDYLFANTNINVEEMYGKGFTYSASLKLELRKHIDANFKLLRSLLRDEFDIIIYPQVNIYRKFLWLLILLNKMPVVIDGQDYGDNQIRFKEIVIGAFSFFKHLKIPHILRIKILNSLFSFLNGKKVVFFKREIYDNINAYPISYSFPSNKINEFEIDRKKRILAKIIPGIKETYIYKDEQSYYNGYKESYFGLTFKKGGWDCLRHYEIIANGCIPYFPDINSCPPRTLVFFPKDIIDKTNKLFEEGFSDEDFRTYYYKIKGWFLSNMTSVNISKYVLRVIEGELD